MEQHKEKDEYYISIPTFEDDVWYTTNFKTRDDYKEFVESVFIDAGPDEGYHFDKTSFEFNKQARQFQKNGYYITAPFKSKDYITYWDAEKAKCRWGVIYKNNGKVWYLTRDYYNWLNFLPIYDKEEKKFDFAKVRDAQYHMALYEVKAELNYKHVALLKKRQIASSYFHMAKIINNFWFENGSVNKIGASLKDYISEKGSWRMLNEYRSFLNENTAWYRPCDPDKIFSWEQRIKVRIGGRDHFKGNKSIITGTSFDKDATAGVGGPCLEPGTLIRMYDGTLKPVEKIKVGNYIIGMDGHPKKVTKLFKGQSNMYKITQSRGQSYTVTEDHILYLWDHYKKNYVKIKTKDFNNLSKYKRTKELSGIKFNGVILPEAILPIDPYYLGLYLGDGCRSDYTILVNDDKDKEITDYITSLCITESHKLKIKYKNRYRNDYNDTMNEMSLGVGRSRDPKILYNSYKNKMDRLGLYKKHIPKIYFQSSIEQRLKLLAGILDTDGHYSISRNRFEITSHFYDLALDIVELCISSGLEAKMYTIKSDGLKSTVYPKSTIGYRIHITGCINKIPCLIKRKRPQKLGILSEHRFSKLSISPIGVGDYFGFKCEDELFVLKDGTVTHNCSIFFHEEGGIAPKAMDTYEFMRPALQSGMTTTGLFIIAGSVGDLDQCGPLKEMVLYPHKYGMQAVTTNLLDENKTISDTGLFIPEQWSMLPYVDEFGNSLVKEALEAIYEERKQWKKDLSPEQYQLRISQKPTNIEEAFATRKESVFPPHLLSHQTKRIEDGEYPVEYIDLEIVDETGKIKATKSNKGPIRKFPIDKTMEDKSGVICIYERPIPNAPWGTYYASIDPVGEGRAEWVDNMIYTPTGKVKIGTIKIGDYVIGSDGNKTKVKGVYPQGKKELYRVSFNDGFSILVCKEHLWKVYPNSMDKKDGHVISVEQMLNKDESIDSKGIGQNSWKKYKTSSFYKTPYGHCKWRIPIVEPIIFEDNILPVDPYFLGLLLGDGCLTTRGIKYASNDQELLDYISSILPEDISVKQMAKYSYNISTNLSRNSLTKKLRDIGIMGKGAATKFIPEIYKISSVQNRLSILQGLLDTDGYCGNHGAEFYSISERLANDVVELTQSLGGVARIRKKITNRKIRNGVGFVYIVRVNLPPQFNPFKLTRKASKYYTSTKFSRYISDISFERIDDAVCISVENEDSLYVTEHAFVTHNTTTSDSLCSIFIYKNPTEVIKDDGNGVIKTHFERDGLVASWCGRFDDLQKTHERLEMMIEWYNAWTLVEANISQFIQYMISKRKQKYLVPKDQIPFLKELSSNSNVYSTYGWKNTGTLFKTHLISYGIQFLQEVLDTQTDEAGNIIKTHFGVERIPDPMLLEEMRQYQPGLNVDRLVAFCALVAFAQIQQNNRGMATRVETKIDKLENSQKLSNLSMRSAFKHMGGNSTSLNKSALNIPPRGAFKNIK